MISLLLAWVCWLADCCFGVFGFGVIGFWSVQLSVGFAVVLLFGLVGFACNCLAGKAFCLWVLWFGVVVSLRFLLGVSRGCSGFYGWLVDLVLLVVVCGYCGCCVFCDFTLWWFIARFECGVLVVSVDSCYVCDPAVGLGLVEVTGLVYWLVCVLCGVFYCSGGVGCLVLLLWLFSFVNSVGCWFIMYCMYGLVACLMFFGLIACCRLWLFGWFSSICILF